MDITRIVSTYVVLTFFPEYTIIDVAINFAFLLSYRVPFRQDIAAYIKKEFDKKHGAKWHCVVGKNFGSFVTHETRGFIYLYRGQVRRGKIIRPSFPPSG